MLNQHQRFDLNQSKQTSNVVRNYASSIRREQIYIYSSKNIKISLARIINNATHKYCIQLLHLQL